MTTLKFVNLVKLKGFVLLNLIAELLYLEIFFYMTEYLIK